MHHLAAARELASEACRAGRADSCGYTQPQAQALGPEKAFITLHLPFISLQVLTFKEVERLDSSSYTH